MKHFLGLALAAASVMSAPAQQPLTLADAARLALDSHPALDAADAAEKRTAEGVPLARSGALPRVSWSESYTRSNNPVFAFGTLLNQKRFSEANFAVPSLNNPEAVQNFQSLISVEQTLFDANRTKQAVRAARLEQEISAVERESLEMDVLLAVTNTYFGVALARDRVVVAEQAVKSADASLRRAEAMFEAGLSTKADVLAVRVHRAAAKQERIRASNDYQVARAALNDAIGLRLETEREIVTPLTPAPAPDGDLAAYAASAASRRPEARQAELGVDLSAARLRAAENSRWPQIVAQGVLEADRGRFVDHGGGNWLAGVSMRWDLWAGSARRAQISASRFAEQQAAALQRQTESAVALRVHQAWYAFASAQERLPVAEETVSEAEENLRIVGNRYESGLDTVTDLLRSETALTEARFGRLMALYEQRTARAALEHAAARLQVTSEVLQ